MRIQLLGPVSAWHDGVPIDLGPSRQRGLLGLLALVEDRPLTRAEIVEALWNDDPPASATNMIQSYVKRLRRVLEPQRRSYQASTVLPAVGDGYALRLPAGAVDARVFRDLVTTAAAAQREGRTGEAAGAYAEAIELWHGPPLADVSLLADHPRVTALSAERGSALVGYARMRGVLGEWAQALPALQEATTAHPLDESAHAWLIHAYHVLGRRADAFALYHRIRHRLVDDLGVDPSAELTAAHTALLHDEKPAEKDEEKPATVAPGSPTPRQLPAAPRLFTGREAHLSWLTKALDTDAAPLVLAIGGIGGIGKTWLALHWAYRHLERFPDGQLYVDLRGFDPSGRPASPTAVVRGFLDALGVEATAVPSGLDAQIGLYRSLVADRRMLVMLDNAADSAQVAPLLPAGRACTVLVTSRRRLTGLATEHGARISQLDVLTPDEARQVLIRHLGAERLATQWDDADELLGYCAGLPLAIGIVAARADAHPEFPLSVLAGELCEHGSRLRALEDKDQQANVRTVLSWSRAALTAEAATVFGLLSVAPGPHIGRPAVEALTALPGAEAVVVLRELENMHLIHQFAPGRYRMHDLVRLHAAEQVGDTLPADALGRLVDFYLSTALAGDHLLDPYRPAIDAATAHGRLDSVSAALTWFAEEHANLEASQHLAARQGRHVVVWQLAWALDTFHWRQGHLAAALAAWQAALTASLQVEDDATRTLVHRRLGHAYALAREHTAALDQLDRALALAESGEDLTAQAHIHHSLAWAWEQQGDNARALEHASHALPLYQKLGMTVCEARELNAVGWYHAQLGEHDAARVHCEAALAMFRGHGNRIGEANTLDSLGYLAYRTGHYATARDHYRRALALLGEIGHAYLEADTLDRLGQTYWALRDHHQARAAWRQAELLYANQGRTADADRTRDQLGR